MTCCHFLLEYFGYKKFKSAARPPYHHWIDTLCVDSCPAVSKRPDAFQTVSFFRVYVCKHQSLQQMLELKVGRLCVFNKTCMTCMANTCTTQPDLLLRSHIGAPSCHDVIITNRNLPLEAAISYLTRKNKVCAGNRNQ